MSTREYLYEKYKKSDIFNLNPNPSLNNSQAQPLPQKRNSQTNKENTQNINYNTIDAIKPINKKKYMVKYHKSDIFNVKEKSSQIQKKPGVPKIRGIPNVSTCFEPMKDNAQFANDIKEYESKYRTIKTEYEPDKYYMKENASERLYNQLYDKKRNPITNENNKAANNDKENNEKNQFLERKKNMRNQFTKKFFNQRTLEDKMRLEQETERGIKNRKFYKSKGFTYMENDNKSINQNNKFVTPDKYINSSKINKQMQLQSNIFSGEETKNENNADIIKERLNKAKETPEEEPNKTVNTRNKTQNKNKNNQEDRNLWGVVNTKWEKSNLDWRNADTEIIFGKTYSGRMTKPEGKELDNRTDSPFQRKMNQLQDSNNKDTINECIKERRKYVKSSYKDRLNHTDDLEKINEILDEIPENILKYDKKKKIMFNANTTGLNGETGVNENFINYNKFHKNVLKKKVKKEPTIKIMSKDGEKRKKVDKNFNNVKKYDEYNIHDFVLSYDTKAKNAKNNFDKFSENEVKLLFSKKGIHVYDIQKNQFDNGKYNVIKFKVRENEGEKPLLEKMKDIENDLTKKEYKICIKKDVEKEKKKNLKHVTNVPGSKVAIFADNNNDKNNLKKKDPLQMKNNTKFTGQFNMIDHKYKKNK